MLGLDVVVGVAAVVESVVEASGAAVVVGVAVVLGGDVVLGVADTFHEGQSQIKK